MTRATGPVMSAAKWAMAPAGVAASRRTPEARRGAITAAGGGAAGGAGDSGPWGAIPVRGPAKGRFGDFEEFGSGGPDPIGETGFVAPEVEVRAHEQRLDADPG